MGSLKLGDDELSVGTATFPRADIRAVRSVIRLYEDPPTIVERVRERLATAATVGLGPIVLVLFLALVVAMAGAVLLALGDSLGFTAAQAAPVAIPIVIGAAFVSWRVGDVIGTDISRAAVSLLAVTRSAFRFHVLMVDTKDGSHPVLASMDFRAVEDLRERIASYLESPLILESFEADLDSPEGKWILGGQMIIEGDRIDFP